MSNWGNLTLQDLTGRKIYRKAVFVLRAFNLLGEYNEVGGSYSWKRCPSFTKGIDRAFCICNLCGSVMHMRQECTWEARLYGGAFIVSQIIKDVYIYCICVFVAVHPATCQRHRTGKRGMGCRPSRRRCEGGLENRGGSFSYGVAVSDLCISSNSLTSSP